MTLFPAGYGTQVTSPTALDADDAILVSVDGVVKNVSPAAVRGYRDASHYADLNEVVINDCETITGFTSALGVQDGGVIQLDSAIKSTGANSVKAKIVINRNVNPMKWYWDAPSDIPVGDHVEAAFDLYTDLADTHNYIKAFVASGVGMTGTVNYAADLTLQFPVNGYGGENTWYKVRIPLIGITNIRSIGITQVSIPSVPTSTRAFFWYDNMVKREATGIDRAVYGAPAGSHIVIPSTYTSAKTQLPIFREQTGITWEDRRS
jgi:hypothetical protein